MVLRFSATMALGFGEDTQHRIGVADIQNQKHDSH
jgi:2-iminoacetate synthase ThiH